MGEFAVAPDGAKGALYFNTADKAIKVYSSGDWNDLGGGGGLWYASGTAAVFDNDVYVGGGFFVQGQRVICPAGQDGTDSFCDYVCTDYYEQTGTEGVDSTEYCYNKIALTSENCGAVGGCKASDYTNCHSQADGTMQYECGLCKYIDTVNCASNVLGSCTNYDTGTYCAYNGHDNGATNYHCDSGTCVCDSSGYTTSPDGKDNDCDGTVDEYVTTCTASTGSAVTYGFNTSCQWVAGGDYYVSTASTCPAANTWGGVCTPSGTACTGDGYYYTRVRRDYYVHAPSKSCSGNTWRLDRSERDRAAYIYRRYNVTCVATVKYY